MQFTRSRLRPTDALGNGEIATAPPRTRTLLIGAGIFLVPLVVAYAFTHTTTGPTPTTTPSSAGPNHGAQAAAQLVAARFAETYLSTSTTRTTTLTELITGWTPSPSDAPVLENITTQAATITPVGTKGAMVTLAVRGTLPPPRTPSKSAATTTTPSQATPARYVPASALRSPVPPTLVQWSSRAPATTPRPTPSTPSPVGTMTPTTTTPPPPQPPVTITKTITPTTTTTTTTTSSTAPVTVWWTLAIPVTDTTGGVKVSAPPAILPTTNTTPPAPPASIPPGVDTTATSTLTPMIRDTLCAMINGNTAAMTSGWVPAPAPTALPGGAMRCTNATITVHPTTASPGVTSTPLTTSAVRVAVATLDLSAPTGAVLTARYAVALAPVTSNATTVWRINAVTATP